MNPNYIFVGVLFLGGLILLADGLSDLMGALRSRAWPRVDGVVSKSKLVSVSKKQRQEPNWKPEIHYTFTFNGTPLTGTLVAFGLDGLAGSRAFATAYVDRYPVGQQVSVCVDPKDPSRSVLEPGLTFKATGSLIIAIVLLVVSSWFASVL